MSPSIKGIRQALCVLCIGLFTAADAFAECSTGSLRLTDLIASADVAFSGVVSRVDRTDVAETATFDVERVWKGDVGSRFFVVAHRLSGAELQQMALDEHQQRFGSDQCGTGIQPLWSVQSELATIGPGHAPAQERGAPRIMPPTKIKDVVATYPPGVSYDIKGIVILEITVAETGKVTDAHVLRSIPHPRSGGG